MTPEMMWKQYCAQEGVTASYDAWQFGDDGDVLAQLVLSGIKSATCSAAKLYELEGEPIPQAMSYSVIQDSREEAVCIIRTDRVWICPYDQVDAQFAYREGEGDRSLSHWRQVHKAFFTQELESVGLSFSPDMPLILEEFTRVYP